MRKFLRKVFQKKAYIYNKLAKKLYQYPEEKRIIKWRLDNGDRTLRLDYDLNEKSVVFDIGGYNGQWTSEIFSKYCCFVYIFEPVEEFALNIKERFFKNKKIFVYDFGLANETKIVNISVDHDSSSTFKDGKKTTEIRLVNIMDFIPENGIEKIDLMKINIEGGEYDLVDSLLKSGFIMKISDLQIQFHDFVENAEERMTKIQAELKKTHELTYQYPFIWENWRIKK